MKKLCALLILALALCGATAFAAEGDALLGLSEDSNLYFDYCFAVGDTLCMNNYGGLYTYKVGDSDLTEYSYAPEEETDIPTDVTVLPFADGDQLYALALINEYSDHNEFVGAKVGPLTLDAATGTATYALEYDVDWDDMVEVYDEDSYATRPNEILGMGGKAYVRCYDNQGDFAVSAIDLSSGKIEALEDLRGTFSMTAYRDGMILVELYDYNAADTARLAVYDPADDSVNPLAEITVAPYSPLQGLAYDPETDTVYCSKGGEVCRVDLEAGEIGEGVTDMPVETYSGAGACVLEGGYYAFASEGAAVRNLDPDQKAATRLKISDSSWSDSITNAYYRFSNANGDVSVILSRDYNDSQNLIENMMNRDDSIDIYVLQTSTNIYDALYNRGYLMELDGSEKALALAERMYPSLREALSRDGSLVALPVNCYAWTMGVNNKALEKLGLTLEDVPDNWSDFLDFVAGLGERMEGTGVTLFYSGMTVRDARNSLFNALFEDYQRFVNQNDPAMGYDTELLRGLLAKLDGIDFIGLGCIEDEEEEDGEGGMIAYDEEGSALLQTGTGCSIGNFYSEDTPVLLRVDPEVPAALTLDMAVAIVNPFTQNPEQAMAFIDELAENLTSSVEYDLCPDLSEPIRGQWNEEYLADSRKMLEDLQAEYEEADAADKQMLEDSIRDAEETLAYAEDYAWEISPREIEWYRANGDSLRVAGYNWLYNDDTGEAWELISQYTQGQISGDALLTAIDQKVQMMLLEGN